MELKFSGYFLKSTAVIMVFIPSTQLFLFLSTSFLKNTVFLKPMPLLAILYTMGIMIDASIYLFVESKYYKSKWGVTS